MAFLYDHVVSIFSIIKINIYLVLRFSISLEKAQYTNRELRVIINSNFYFNRCRSFRK